MELPDDFDLDSIAQDNPLFQAILQAVQCGGMVMMQNNGDQLGVAQPRGTDAEFAAALLELRSCSGFNGHSDAQCEAVLKDVSDMRGPDVPESTLLNAWSTARAAGDIARVTLALRERAAEHAASIMAAHAEAAGVLARGCELILRLVRNEALVGAERTRALFSALAAAMCAPGADEAVLFRACQALDVLLMNQALVLPRDESLRALNAGVAALARAAAHESSSEACIRPGLTLHTYQEILLNGIATLAQFVGMHEATLCAALSFVRDGSVDARPMVVASALMVLDYMARKKRRTPRRSRAASVQTQSLPCRAGCRVMPPACRRAPPCAWRASRATMLPLRRRWCMRVPWRRWWRRCANMRPRTSLAILR
jgi:hypothetical protein